MFCFGSLFAGGFPGKHPIPVYLHGTAIGLPIRPGMVCQCTASYASLMECRSRMSGKPRVLSAPRSLPSRRAFEGGEKRSKARSLSRAPLKKPNNNLESVCLESERTVKGSGSFFEFFTPEQIHVPYVVHGANHHMSSVSQCFREKCCSPIPFSCTHTCSKKYPCRLLDPLRDCFLESILFNS